MPKLSHVSRNIACSVAALVAFGGAIFPANGSVSITGLGVYSGKTESYGYGVDATGTVVVGESRVAAADTQAVRWTAGTGMLGLGDLFGGIDSSAAYRVSADSLVIVGQGNSASGREAFRWTSAGMVGLGDLSGGTFESFAGGVNADGSVVVGRGQSASGEEAFRWTSAGGMVGLGDLPGGSFDSIGLGVSADGSVVVGQGRSASGTEAFRWTAAGGMVGLGDLPGGIFTSSAADVSSDGSILVGRSSSTSGTQAFRWTLADGMVPLGFIGGTFSEARAVSDDGSVIVGIASVAGGNLNASIWTPSGGMQRLWDVLVANGVDPAATGWSTLFEAIDVSPDGRFIVGSGLRNGEEQAFLVTVPEPSTFGLLLTAVATIATRRRRCRR
jgi:probable HAF family extracellular repeat protein